MTNETIIDTEAERRKDEDGFGALPDIIERLEQIRDSAIDVVMDAEHINFVARKGQIRLAAVPETKAAHDGWLADFPALMPRAIAQVGARATPAIPGGYLKELVAAGEFRTVLAADLLQGTVEPQRVFLRMIDSRVRAVLSERFRVMDSCSLAWGVLDAVKDAGGSVLKASLTDSSFKITAVQKHVVEHIATEALENGGRNSHRFISAASLASARRKALAPMDFDGIEGEGDKGIAVYPAMTVTNSEVGEGGVNVWWGIFEGGCTNNLMLTREFAKTHLGSALDVGIYRPETLEAESNAIMLKARDCIHAGLQEQTFRRMVAKVREAHAHVVADPTSAVANVVKATDLSEEAQKSILEYFLRDYGGRTRYELSRAVSRYAQDAATADREGDLEVIAGRIVNEPALVG